jgi:hypothetical protein
MSTAGITDTDTRGTDAPRYPALAGGNTVVAIVPGTLEEVQRMATMLLASGLAPRDYDTMAKIACVIMAGAEVGLPPMQALQSIALINGRPALYGDGLLAVVIKSGRLERITEKIADRDGENPTATCIVVRDGHRVARAFSRKDAQVAGLWGKRTYKGEPTPWITHPMRMLQMRARAFALRDVFPDVLRGMASAEEMADFIPTNGGSGGDGARTKIVVPPPPPAPDAVVWEEEGERPATVEDIR